MYQSMRAYFLGPIDKYSVYCTYLDAHIYICTYVCFSTGHNQTILGPTGRNWFCSVYNSAKEMCKAFFCVCSLGRLHKCKWIWNRCLDVLCTYFPVISLCLVFFYFVSCGPTLQWLGPIWHNRTILSPTCHTLGGTRTYKEWGLTIRLVLNIQRECALVLQLCYFYIFLLEILDSAAFLPLCRNALCPLCLVHVFKRTCSL